jgi:hypothetical protein
MWLKYCVPMRENEKMRPDETIMRWGKEDKE